MTRFYFALALLTLMGLHESIVAMLAANVVGFSMAPLLVFVLLAISPFILILANGLPSLFSLLPQSASEGALPTINVQATSPIDSGALAAMLGEAVVSGIVRAQASAPRPAPATAAPAPIATAPAAATVPPTSA